MVPLRVAASVFGATEYETFPGPGPFPPDAMVIHASLLTAVQAHPVAVVPVTCAVPPPACAPCEVGLIVKVRGAPPVVPVPACVTVKATPPTMMLPVRSAPLLGATV